ncbi:MAG: PEPxxWA-CTERM sorting domain-containing protein [Sphingomonas sp.]|jgi:hypothetical protein
MIRKTLLGIMCATAMMMPAAANAAPVIRNLILKASDFSLLFGDGSVAPIPSIDIHFSVSFDNSASIPTSSAGLRIFDSNYPGTLQFSYSSSADQFVLASFPGVGSCGNPANSFCTFISGISGATPAAFLVQQSTATGGYFVANTFSLSAVPEPATWAMMIGGFGLVGGAMRNRRRAAASVSFG